MRFPRPPTAFLKNLNLYRMMSLCQCFWQSGRLLERQQSPAGSDDIRHPLRPSLSQPAVLTAPGWPPSERGGAVGFQKERSSCSLKDRVWVVPLPESTRFWAGHWVPLKLRLLTCEVCIESLPLSLCGRGCGSPPAAPTEPLLACVLYDKQNSISWTLPARVQSCDITSRTCTEPRKMSTQRATQGCGHTGRANL